MILTNQKLHLGLYHCRGLLEPARYESRRLIMKLVWHTSNSRLGVLKTVTSQLGLEERFVVTDAST